MLNFVAKIASYGFKCLCLRFRYAIVIWNQKLHPSFLYKESKESTFKTANMHRNDADLCSIRLWSKIDYQRASY